MNSENVLGLAILQPQAVGPPPPHPAPPPAPPATPQGWVVGKKMTGNNVHETVLGCLIESDALRGLLQSAMIELKADNYE